MDSHESYMALALEEAKKAGQIDEVPIGAVIVAETGEVLAKAYNQTISLADPTAHAEILAVRNASKKLENYRLLNTILYATVEPCVMCMGAIIHARIAKVVFGTFDPKWGGAGSLYNMSQDNRLNHQVETVSGIRMEECREIIQNFFRSKRNKH